MLSVQPRGAMLAVAVLLAGCALAPQNVAQTEEPALGSTPAPGSTQGLPSTSGAGPQAPGVAATSVAPAGTVALRDNSPDALVVDLNKRPPDEAENSGQICREMLKPDTNSLITVCGTPAQWKKFRAAESAQAEDNLLRWQAGRF
jgi:hypothetical protein